MGNKTLEGQDSEAVLAMFDRTAGVARKEYLKFVTDGIGQGRRDELVGGGLKRSHALIPDKDRGTESYDERILGSGAFVDKLRREKELREKLFSGMTLSELATRVEQYFLIKPDQLGLRRKNPTHQRARDIFCALAVRDLSFAGTVAGDKLNIRRAAVSHAVRRGTMVLAESPELRNEILGREE
jgi:hypothetical protein